MKAQNSDVAAYFERDAKRFDAIYDGEGPSFIHRLVDGLFRRQSLRVRMARASEMVPFGSSCLDVGCGSGRVAVHLAVERNCRVTGLDASAHMIELSTQLAEQAGTAEVCKFVTGNFADIGNMAPADCVIMLGLIDYVEEPEELIAAALAHAGDRVVLSYPKSLRMLNPVRRSWLKIKKGVSVRFYSDNEIDTMAKAAKGRVTSRKTNGRFPFFEDVVVTIQSE